MFFWFIGTAVLAVWYVFRDPRFDYRLLVVGSVLPLADALFAPGDGPGMRWMHSLVFSVALLVARDGGDGGSASRGASCCSGSRSARSCTSCSTAPGRRPTCSGGRSAAGTSVNTSCRRPSAAGGTVVLEVVGLAIVVWIWRRQRLAEPDRRRRRSADRPSVRRRHMSRVTVGPASLAWCSSSSATAAPR